MIYILRQSPGRLSKLFMMNGPCTGKTNNYMENYIKHNLYPGVTFYDIAEPNSRLEVLNVNEKTNTLKVKYTNFNGTSYSDWNNNFNLEHILVGFTQGIYKLKNKWVGYPLTFNENIIYSVVPEKTHIHCSVKTTHSAIEAYRKSYSEPIDQEELSDFAITIDDKRHYFNKEDLEYLSGDDVIKATNTLMHALKNDLEMYKAYKSNIAMAFIDEFKRSELKTPIGTIANKAAENFLNLFIKK